MYLKSNSYNNIITYVVIGINMVYNYIDLIVNQIRNIFKKPEVLLLTEAFKKLSEEKQELILKVCIEEFAKNGYDHTSTDVLTSKAGISKGILFHYFKSKKNLYLYIVKTITDSLVKIMLEEAEKVTSQDFFERIKAMTIIKQKLAILYPKESELIVKTFINPPVKLQKEINEIYIEILNFSQGIYDKYLFSYMKENRLKLGVSKERALEFSMILLEGYSNKIMLNYKGKEMDLINNAEPIFKELDEYIEIIKYGIYK